MKLVRDKIPEIIRKKGEPYSIRFATEEEFKNLLHSKLQEEVEEYLQSKDANELVDILEVIIHLAKGHNLSHQKLEEKRQLKERQHGSFNKKIILE